MPRKITKTIQTTLPLSSIEAEAYDKWLSNDRSSLSITTAAKFYELFLQGCSCEEIARLNQGVDLGAIIDARLKYDWDKEKSIYITNLMSQIREQTQKNYMESVKFLGNVLTTVHMRFEEKLKKYFQTKDEADLGEFALTDMKEYRHNLDLFFRLTGQDAKAVKGVSQINVNIEGTDTKVSLDQEDAEHYLRDLNKASK